MTDAPADYVESMLGSIVGIEIAVTSLVGKWKVSQNRTEEERKGVFEGLSKLNTPESLAMKALVEEV